MELDELFLRFIEKYHNVLLEADKTEKRKGGFPDITINQYFYLQGVQRNENITLTELAKKLGVSKPSATVAITRLINDGFLVRTRSEVDQRKFHLFLSDKGRQVFLHKKNAYKKFIEQIEEKITPEQHKLLVEAFSIMVLLSPEHED